MVLLVDLQQEIDSLITFNDKDPKDMTKEDWLDDFNSLFNLVKENFPYLYVKERMLGYNWLDLKDNYLKRLEEAKEVKEYLEIFHDAVTALQDGHGSIHLAHTFDYFYEEGSWAQEYIQKHPTLRKVFAEELKNTIEYWAPITKEFYSERYSLNFDALILYSKGEYRICDGIGSWEEKYRSGSVIIAVNGSPIDEAIKGTYEKDYLYWDVKRKKLYQLYIDPKMFGPEAKFTIKTKEGEIREVVFDSSMDYNYFSIFNYPSEFLTTKIWSERKIAYVRFGSFEQATYDEETVKYLKAFYQKVRNFDHLIIDIRGNSGGLYQVWTENIVAPITKRKLAAKLYSAYKKGKYTNLFRKDGEYLKEVNKAKLTNCPPEVLTDDYAIYDASITVEPLGEITFNANTALLVDSNTYSAATTFTLFCKETGFAKVYGTPDKGEGVPAGPIFYILPNSKILIRFFQGLGLDSKGNACEEVKVQPDIYYESELHNFDELLNYVIDDLNKRD